MNLKIQLDNIFSLFIRMRDTASDWHGFCVTCGKTLFFVWGEAQNCHYISRDKLRRRYAEDNCTMGCTSCNHYRKDFHYAQYTKIMVKKLWQKEVDERREGYKSNEIRKIRTFEYRDMIDLYTDKCLALLLTKDSDVATIGRRKIREAVGVGKAKERVLSAGNDDLCALTWVQEEKTERTLRNRPNK